MIDNLTESVILSSEIDQWKPTILNCIEDFNNIENLKGPIDLLNRPITDLRISLIDQCNFRCTYCMPKEIFIFLC